MFGKLNTILKILKFDNITTKRKTRKEQSRKVSVVPFFPRFIQ